MTATCVRTCDKRPPPTPYSKLSKCSPPRPRFSSLPYIPYPVYRLQGGPQASFATRQSHTEAPTALRSASCRTDPTRGNTHTHTHTRVHVLRFIILIMSGLATTAAHQPPSGFAQSARATHQPNGVLTQLQHVTPCRAPSTRHVQYVTPGCRSLNT